MLLSNQVQASCLGGIMKGFNRKNQFLSLCGLNCGLCPMFLNKTAPAAVEGRKSVVQDRKVHGTWRSRILLSMQGVPM